MDICLLQSAVFAYHECLKIICGLLTQLLFNQFIPVLRIAMLLLMKEKFIGKRI